MSEPHAPSSPRVLLAGGYGVVGAQVARLLRRYHPELRLVIAGRTAKRAHALAQEVGNAEATVLDTGDADPLAGIDGPFDAVIGLVHDADDRLLRAAIRRKAAYADITRGVAAQARAFVSAALESPVRPVLFASNWMAGVPATLALHAAKGLSSIETIALSILFDQRDLTGPDSADASSDIGAPFVARTNGAWTTVPPMSASGRIRFPSGRTRRVYRMNMADVTTLAQATGARDVLVRIGLDSDFAAASMRALIRLGLWNLVQSSMKGGANPAHNPKAKGAAHEIVIDIAGRDGGGPAKRRVTILDPRGQAHLTALGATYSVARVLGLSGAALRPGIAVPETDPDAARLLHLLDAEGVETAFTPS